MIARAQDPEALASATVRFVELVRVSTKGQAERETPELQRHALDELRRQYPGVLVERIEGLGVSGGLSVEQRPDLLRLRELTMGRAYDEIRVYAIDRLTRHADPRERFAVFGFALDAGAKIRDTSGRLLDPADESGIGEIDFYLSSFFAAKERAKIKKRTEDGRRRRAAQGFCANSHMAFGLAFDKAANSYAIVEDKAAIVRRIFDEAAQGRTLRQILDGLDRDGIPSPRGKNWSRTVIAKILRHPAYRGEYRQTFGGQSFTAKVPAIISAEQWNEVQRGLTARQNIPIKERYSFDALCRGLGRCGVCGAGMHVFTKARKYRYYYCASQHTQFRGARCEHRNGHRSADVDAAVWALLREKIENSTLIEEAASQAERDDGGKSWAKQKVQAEVKLSKLAAHEVEVLRLRSDEKLSEGACRLRLSEIARQRENLKATVEVAERAMAQDAALRSTARTLAERIDVLRGQIGSASFAARRALLEALVPKAPGFGLIFHEDGRVEIRGALAFEDGQPAGGGEGPQTAGRRLGKPSVHPSPSRGPSSATRARGAWPG